MSRLRMGILGAGGIARVMADTLQKMDTAEAYAVAARDLDRAQAFADEFSVKHAYGSYEELLRDPKVELIYIATPHSLHKEQAMRCLEAGKPVLCEKAFTSNASEAREVLETAREKQVFITEAIWPRYMPMAKILKDFCGSGKIGEIKALTANLGYPVFQNERIHRADLAGGALLDVGVYPRTFASRGCGGGIEDITASAVISEEGVDLQNSIILTYKGGQTATIFSTVTGPTDRQGILYGTAGYAIVENINNFEEINVYNTDHKRIERIERPAQITGYEYEVQAAVDCIREGKIECPQMPHKEIVRIMELMDKIRAGWGMKYPWEM